MNMGLQLVVLIDTIPEEMAKLNVTMGVLWRKITATLMSRGLPDNHWESVIPDALYSQRSLLCKATNTTPHKRMFTFPRKSSSGYSIPSWLSY